MIDSARRFTVVVFFFFQAEDGIRDADVTGVQTCALPISLVTMVGTNIGAGRLVRARRVAWVGAGLAAMVTGSIGLFGACFPHLWLGLFSTNPEVLAVGTTYLRIVGPTYGCFGLGLALYFASQGAGRLLWPLLASGARLVIAAGAGWMAIRWGTGSLPTLFAPIAVALIVYAMIVARAMQAEAWPAGTPST